MDYALEEMRQDEGYEMAYIAELDANAEAEEEAQRLAQQEAQAQAEYEADVAQDHPVARFRYRMEQAGLTTDQLLEALNALNDFYDEVVSK